MLQSLSRSARMAAFLATDPARSVRTGQSPHEVVARVGKARVRYFAPEQVEHAPVFVCMPLINTWSIFDLLPERSVVRELVAHGTPVYLLDWGRPGPEDRYVSLLDLIEGVLHRSLERARRHATAHHGTAQLDAIGYCVGGTFLAVYLSRHPTAVQRVAFVATPIDFKASGRLALWASEETFPLDALIDGVGNFPRRLMQTSFQWLKLEGQTGKWRSLHQRFDKPGFKELWAALEQWSADGVDFPGEAYREYVRRCYFDNALMTGSWRLGNTAVDLSRVEADALVLAAAGDHIVPPPSAHALRRVWGGRCHVRDASRRTRRDLRERRARDPPHPVGERMKGSDFDPLAAIVGPFVQGIGGMQQTEAVRRGMHLHAITPRPPVGLTTHDVIHRHDKLAVRYYAPRGPVPAGPPVVIVPSLINRAYICDLEPDRSLVAGLAELGHAVYLVDWGVPGPEDAQEDVGYVLLTLLDRAMARIRRHARARTTHVLGYCMGGTIAGMYAALRPAHLESLVALNAPFHFAAGGRFASFVSPEAFDVDHAIDGDGLMSVAVMQSAFKLLDPMGNWSKFIALDKASADPTRLRRSLARERWLEDNVPMAGAFAREFIRNAYQSDKLMDGSWVVRGETVDLGAITCPTLVIACERDFITPKEAALPLADLVGSERVLAEVLQAGHIGVVVGGFGPAVFYPRLDRWFRAEARP